MAMAQNLMSLAEKFDLAVRTVHLFRASTCLWQDVHGSKASLVLGPTPAALGRALSYATDLHLAAHVPLDKSLRSVLLWVVYCSPNFASFGFVFG